MFSEFSFDLPDSSAETSKARGLSAKDEALFQKLLGQRLTPERREQLERLLLQRLKEKKSELRQTLKQMSCGRNYEEFFYRYYHGSFKVYSVQSATEHAVKLLRELLPERELNLVFEEITGEGTGKTFIMEHNRDWDRHTRPMLEAFAHAKFMIEMAVRYSDLSEPPRPLPSGYAALLYLYNMR